MPAPGQHPAVEVEIREAARWYDERCPGLGDQFIDAIRAAIRVPLRHAIRYADLRRVLLKRFPYSVWFFEQGNRVFVLSVMHNKREHRSILATRHPLG